MTGDDTRRNDTTSTDGAPGSPAGRTAHEEVTVNDTGEGRADRAATPGEPAADTVTVEGVVGNPGDQAPDAALGGMPTAGAEGADTAGGGETPPAEDPELTALRTELAERTADLQRVSAEYANYRRRVERDREATVANAKASIASELLTVLDDVERAGSHGDLTGPFKSVADRLTDALHRAGLAGFGEVGDGFDPSVHEAVAHGTSAEVDGPTVTTVMRRGYRFGEKVLRPAMVEVTDHDPDAVPAGSGSAAGSESG